MKHMEEAKKDPFNLRNLDKSAPKRLNNQSFINNTEFIDNTKIKYEEIDNNIHYTIKKEKDQLNNILKKRVGENIKSSFKMVKMFNKSNQM